MASNFGSDIDCGPDGLSDLFELVSGPMALAQALFRRFETERGSLVDDPNYGLDVQAWIGVRIKNTAQLFAWQQALVNEAKKDERVYGAKARVAFDSSASKLTFSLSIESAEGPFTMTVEVTELSVQLLTVT